MEALEKLSIETFSERLASEAPTPGGGALMGLELSLALSLAQMVLQLSIGKRCALGHEEELTRLERSFDALRQEALLAIGEDGKAFDPVAQLYRRRPQKEEGEAELEGWRAQLDEALYQAASMPLAYLPRLEALAKQLVALEPRIHVLVKSDLLCAYQALDQALSLAALHAALNLNLQAKPTERTEAAKYAIEQHLSAGRACLRPAIEALEMTLLNLEQQR